MAFLQSVPAGIGPAARRYGPSLLRLAAGVTVLWFLARQVGGAPFRAGLRAVTWQAVLAAVTLTVLTTVCSAWRWRAVARSLGVDISLPGAVSAYYRSLFLNSVLVGGVLGDVHRAVTHGRRVGDVAVGLRAVGWERLCGQVIQAVVTAVVLLTLPSPVRPALPYVLAGVAVLAGCTALVVRAAARRGRSRLGRGARAVSADLRHGLLAPGVWPQLALASVLVVAGHTATFVIAARVGRQHRAAGRTGRAADAGPDGHGDPPEYRRLGAEGRSRRLGLRRSRAGRRRRGHGHHPVRGPHAGRGGPGRGAAAGRRRPPAPRPATAGRDETNPIRRR